MWRVLDETDREAVDAFLAAHADVTLFLRGNVREKGFVDDGTRCSGAWVGAFRDGVLHGVVMHAWNGNLITCAPRDPVAGGEAALAATGRPLLGIVGPGTEVSALKAGLGLDPTRIRYDQTEFLYALALDALKLPDMLETGQVEGRLVTVGDVALLTRWMLAYRLETVGESPSPALMAELRTRHIQEIGDEGRLLLFRDGRMVATTAFNARTPDTVQVGGVYTPPEERGRGHARSAVAAHLMRARAQGVDRSVLFTAPENHPAQRCYLSLGYRRIGDYGLLLLHP